MECRFTDYEKTVDLFGFKLYSFYAAFLKKPLSELLLSATAI
jgi:hypothetical protein